MIHWDWIISIINILGVLMVVWKTKWGFPVMLIASVYWAGVFYNMDKMPIVFVQLVYTGLNIYGWFKWSKEERDAKERLGQRQDASEVKTRDVGGSSRLEYFGPSKSNLQPGLPQSLRDAYKKAKEDNS